MASEWMAVTFNNQKYKAYRKYKPPNRRISNLWVLAPTGTESRCRAILVAVAPDYGVIWVVVAKVPVVSHRQPKRFTAISKNSMHAEHARGKISVVRGCRTDPRTGVLEARAVGWA